MKQYLLLFIFLLLSGIGFSQSNYWNKLNYKSIPNTKDRLNTPKEYILMNLDLTAFNSSIKEAPNRQAMNKNTQTRVLAKFPDSKGNLDNYIVYEAPSMHPALQAKFPEIKSYVAYKVNEPSSSIRFSISPQFGLHGMIFSKNGISYIDSYYEDNNTYMIYDRKNLSEPLNHFICETGEEESSNFSSKNMIPLSVNNVNDGKLRKYRLALACTTEYATYHINRAGISGGTIDQKKATVLAAMNVTMTRINGIYEKELSITMELVPNNDQLVFITSDSYSNDSGSAMLAQNQTVCDNVIGSNNYDIGHVFSTGGGGVAYLRSPCNSFKAGGVTGSRAPVGDPFDVDYVAHEMGHQYGAHHTFNNSCYNNRNNSTAVEPGSGSTIMAYAGICSPDVQQHSDAYFHAVSINEIYSNITVGSGTCSYNTISGNNSPTASAGNDYTIPKSTAYVLTGTGTDPDGDQLTYCWEQIDTEIASMPPQSTSTGGPASRSLMPTTSSERYFPALSQIVTGSLTSEWEVIPSVARTLNYSLTVRDNNPIGGQSARDDMKITVNGSAGPFKVTSQTLSSETWYNGSSVTITWDVANTNTPPVNCQNVKIVLSTDNGLNFSNILASNLPNNGTANIIVPSGIDTNNARIMVKAEDNIFLAVNSTNFNISSQMGIEDIDNSKNENLIYPNPSQGVFYLNLNSNNQMVSYSVWDISGKLLEKSKVTNNTFTSNLNPQINLSHLPSGSYLIKIETDKNTITKKIIIKK